MRSATSSPSDSDPVTVELGSNPGDAILGGVREVTPSGGVAVFDDLVIEAAADGSSVACVGRTRRSPT
ncbi:MAG: hypothetical protein U5R14_14760 [Gemmatimonadota bacterium]|nr:hypothetical protein [Gemmatimonadota bacterium]